ncbi:hypothetical protein BGX26_000472 [Mortierella sp. AD094]|nr:hypothetical protein BGX26_000472 [Mortierella sp. AD094]
MNHSKPSAINITITPCTGLSTTGTISVHPEAVYPAVQQLPESSTREDYANEDENLEDRNYPNGLAEGHPRATNTNVVTRDHHLGQITIVPAALPHRQIRHAEPPVCLGMNHKSREKIQKSKANRVSPAGRPDDHQNGKQEYDEYAEDGYVNQQRRSNRELGGEQYFTHEHQPSYGGDEYLAAGGQLEMYRTKSYMSQLSYERGVDSYEKHGGYGSGGDGYGSTVFRIDPEMESRVLRKLDRNLLPLLGILYLFSYLDRVNIGNARLFGLEEDVKMTDGQYSMGSISLGLAWVTSFKGLVIARFALGAAEAGAFGGILAAGISHLSGKLGLQGWQWIFILEAIPTILLAVLTWLIMSPSPEEARFLTPDERIYAANRVLADTDIRPTPQASWKQTKAALTDGKVYLICLCFFFVQIASSGVILLLPSLIADMGFKATTAQLLTSPITWLQLWYRWRSHGGQTGFKFEECLRSLSSWPSRLVKYLACMFALSGMIPTGSILTSWLTNNFIGHTKRATALAMLVLSGSLASMAGTQVYRTSDAPRYQHGHLIMACSMVLMVLTVTLLRATLARENRRRDKNLSKGLTLIQFMSDGQFSEVGDHPNFRYTL